MISIKGEIYNYVVFWTRIMNETDNALELNINFPLNSYEIPSLTGKYYEILIPSDTMTIEKSPLYLYGLSNFETFLNNNIHKESNLKRTINYSSYIAISFLELSVTLKNLVLAKTDWEKIFFIKNSYLTM